MGTQESDRRGKVRIRVSGRSGARRLLWLLLPLGLVLGFFLWDFSIQKNFEEVVPGKLYRSGQPSEGQLEDWIREYGLRSIVSLRHSIPGYERDIADRHGLRLYSITFSAKTGIADSQWEELRGILTDEGNQPVLVHCQSGVDRTGMVVALYRIEVQGWPLDRALREMILNYHLPFQYPTLQDDLRRRFPESTVTGIPAAAVPAPAETSPP